jgi:hypothetical protein
MELLQRLLAFLWSMIQQLLAPILGAFNRAGSVRRADDGTGP